MAETKAYIKQMEKRLGLYPVDVDKLKEHEIDEYLELINELKRKGA